MLLVVFFLVGFICNIIFSVLDLLRTYFQLTNVYSFAAILYPLRLLPIFALLYGHQKIHKLSAFAQLCGKLRQAKMLDTLCALLNGNEKSQHELTTSILKGCCGNTCDQDGGLCYEHQSLLAVNEFGLGIELICMIVCGLLCMSAILIYECERYSTCIQVFSIIIFYPILAYILQILQFLRRLAFKTKLATVPSNCTIALTQVDKDIEEERKRVKHQLESGNNMTDILLVARLGKKSNSVIQLDELTFGVRPAECFGLLGVNGAGKSTTFSLLSGDLSPTCGDAFIQDIDEQVLSLSINKRQFQSIIGYCPQFDALLDNLTGEETLALFGRLRGIPSQNLSRDITNLFKLVSLDPHLAHKCTGTYSGGSRRKLSIAIALMGSPQILLLDELSVGLDPVARRKVWHTLKYLKQHFACTIVLTSHSTEECEALCSRIGILVNGKLRCLGSTHHLRSKYCQGYSLTISLPSEKRESWYLKALHNEFVGRIPAAELQKSHQTLMHCHIPDPTIRLASLFQHMAALDEQFHFEDCIVSDANLKETLIKFAQYPIKSESTTKF